MKKTALALFISSLIAPTALAAPSADNVIFSYTNTQDLSKPLDLSSKLAEKNAFSLKSGSLTLRVRNLANKNSGIISLFGASNPENDLQYISFFINVTKEGENKLSVEFREKPDKVTSLPKHQDLTVTIPHSQNDFHTITYTFDEKVNKIKIYVDGELKKTSQNSKFFGDIRNLKTAFLGKTKRNSLNNWRSTDNFYHAELTSEVLKDTDVSQKHKEIVNQQQKDLATDAIRRTAFGSEKSIATPLFQAGQKDSKNYRIPALITTKDNVVIAAIDKRHKHSADWGNIDTVIRRSFDGGKTWEDDQVVIDLAEQPNYGNIDSAFLIDPLMVQDRKTGRLFMMVDMFPETQGFFGINKNHNSEGTGYKNVGGKSYRVLTDSSNQQYTVRENGIVFDENNLATEYRVVIEGDKSKAFRDLGDLYKGNERVGNIFLQVTGKVGENKDTAPLKTKITSYLWMTYSDDNGETWSNPVDLNPQIKADWMRFLGTGPGNGIQLKNGNLIVPIYYTNSNNKQSSAVLISTDGGKTWERSESPNDRFLSQNGGSRYLNNSGYEITESQIIELNNGDLKMFSRNLNGKVHISTSKNGGYTWLAQREFAEELADPYSQMSVIKYSKLINGKEYVLFANPHSSTRSRVNGKVWLGEVQEDGTIEWKYNSSITTGSYAYNSLTELPNGDIGLLYEESAEKIQYVSLNLQELLWRDNILHNDIRKKAREFSLNGENAETFYKIGDGEIIKVGVGINPADLIIQEGTATLNQKADENNEKQAFASVLVEKEGKVRLSSSDQLPLNKLYLNNGTLDLNGNAIPLSNTDQLKTAKDNQQGNYIYGNIVNENATTDATLTYTLDGDKYLVGNLGNEQGNLNLTYQPTADNSHLSINGNTLLNMIDVKSGKISYLANTNHQATNLNLSNNATLSVLGNTTTVIKTAQLGNNSQIQLTTAENENSTFTVNTAGTGQFNKEGKGLVKLSGNLTHSGGTTLKEGKIEFNGSLSNGKLTLNENTVFGGTAKITGDSHWKNSSVIAPGFNQPNDSFGSQVMQFANVINEGATVLLRVNNTNEEINTWEHDQLLVSGNLQSNSSIPVDVKFLGSSQGNSDTNNNGEYDVDEGISMIQVLGESETGKFTLGKKLDANNTESSLFQYTLVSVDKPISHLSDNKFGNSEHFYDYRLQTLLVDEQGNNPEPVIRNIGKSGTSITHEKPHLTDIEIADIFLKEKNEALKKLSDKEKALLQAQADQEMAEIREKQAKADAQKAKDDQVIAESKEKQAKADAQKAKDDQVIAESKEKQAKIDTQKAKDKQNIAEEKAAQTIDELKKLQEAQDNLAKNAENNYRVALTQKVPSYLIANTAILNQGDNIRRQFMSNIWSDDKQGFYVNQQNGSAKYTSNLSFKEYGYGYKARQSSTLFGGFTSLGENTELHAAIGLSKQKVTPKAADGSSETRYKSTAFLAGLHNKWDNFILNTILGYHSHRGKVSTSEKKDISRIESSQFQLTGEVGYEISLGQFSVTPILGLNYQKLRTTVKDHQTNWNVSLKPYNVFSQHIGTNLSWKNDYVHLSAGVFYENNSTTSKAVHISAGNEKGEFATGRQGNALRFNVNSDFAITKQLSLGLRVEHTHAVSKAKLKQTEISGKLEYKF